MGTLVNGIKEIFATSQTTATHLPVCASDGTPQGRISVGDLASVLGAMTSKGLLSLNWNSDDVEQGVYQIQPSQQTDLPSGITDRAVIMIGRASASSEYCRFALLCDASSNTVKRYWINTFRSTWNGWAELTFDMPSFYKNYSTLSALASALNVADLGSVIMKYLTITKGVGGVTDTGISVNGGNGGRAVFAICSGHSGAGDVTCASIYLLRCGYDGGHLSKHIILETGSTSDFDFSVSSNNTIQITQPNGSCKAFLIAT